jgi:hypothetical protein
MPIKNNKANMMNWVLSSAKVRSQNKGKATSVPAVPGALGDKPKPNPSAKKWLGWLIKISN